MQPQIETKLRLALNLDMALNRDRTMPNELDAAAVANRAFYKAFRSRDLAAMDRVWSHSGPVACLHPGQEPILCRSAIMGSWRDIMAGELLDISPANEQAIFFNGTVLILCEEVIAEKPVDEVLIASNLFVMESTGWMIAVHHAGRRA
jgi:SnoaL-like domain